MSPDCFNQCPECDLILSVPNSRTEVDCPRCMMRERRQVQMHLVDLSVPLRPRYGPRWGDAADAAASTTTTVPVTTPSTN